MNLSNANVTKVNPGNRIHYLQGTKSPASNTLSNADWYKKCPWISYEIKDDQCVCNELGVFSESSERSRTLTVLTSRVMEKCNERMRLERDKQL